MTSMKDHRPLAGMRRLLATMALAWAAASNGAAPADALAPPALPADGGRLAGDAMPGAFFQSPAGPGPFPAVIVLGGSEGGDSSARRMAPLLLDQGYAVLGLPYYSPDWGSGSAFPQLPAAFHDIPLDTLETARDWLRRQPAVARSKIGLWGVSKGAEFALAGASRIDGFDAVVAIVPSDVIWEGWGPGTTEGQSSSFSWRGKPLPFVPYVGMSAEIAKFGQPGQAPRLRTPHDAGRNAHPSRVEAARIRVEAIDEPVLVAGGDRDDTWASGPMAQRIAERRAACGLITVSVVALEAGHGLSGNGAQFTEGTFRYSAADLAAQAIVWPATLAFFAEHLQGRREVVYPAGTTVVRATAAPDPC